MDEQLEHSVNYELLGRFFSGECTPEEAVLAQSWIGASQENRATYEALRTIWEQAQDPSGQEPVNTEAAWERLSGRLGLEETEATPPRLGRSMLSTWWRIAAALVVAVGLSLVVFQPWGKRELVPQIEVLALEAGDTTRTDTLPDGSVVTLNAHSSLRFPERFAGLQREVELEGEAFFEVERDPAHPFLIHAGTADIRVLGTSFNVRTADSLVEVVVATGKVELSAPEDERARPVILEAGQRGDYSSEKGRIAAEENQDENYLYWKDRRLIFRNTPMHEVADELKALFGTEIRLEGKNVKDCPLTTTFENQSVESILNIIAETFNLEVTQDANSYTLQGQGCQ